jgi:hypothetical protein
LNNLCCSNSIILVIGKIFATLIRNLLISANNQVHFIPI